MLIAIGMLAAMQQGLPSQEEAIQTEGIVRPARSVRLSLPTEAILREVRVKEGATVREGQILAILYSPAELLEQQRARKQLERAEFLLQNSEKLRAGAIISEEDARQKQIDADIARIEALRAEAVLRDKTLLAPFDGVVLRIFKEPGETVGRVDEIIEIVDLANLYVDLFLDGTLIGRVSSNTKAMVNIPSLGSDLEAEIQMIDPVVDPGSGLFRMRLRFPNPGMKIRPGVPARAVLHLVPK